MKNKEEPSVDSPRGNPWEQADLHFPDRVGSQTTGSVSRPGRTVAAHTEQPALSDFSESLMERIVAPANIETAWKNVKANRGAPGPDSPLLANILLDDLDKELERRGLPFVRQVGTGESVVS
jgi:RNA-directed DNA polymerase